MCGRFTEKAKAEKIAGDLKTPVARIPKIKPRYNIAPSQPVLCMFRGKEQESSVEFFRWGLIPAWAKDPSVGHRMINARAETLTAKPAFRTLMETNRCLVIADGFYEWKDEGSRKIPYYIRLKTDSVFTFAGLWSEWHSPEGDSIRSCTIITGEPNELMKPIHPRMPVIVSEKSRMTWLHPGHGALPDVMACLAPYPASEMDAYPVSTLVNKPGNDFLECVQPLPPLN